jgi:ATP-binding cassette subfamily B (MDR/TAP) protein 1
MATTPPGMAAGVQLEGDAIDDSLTPEITVSNSFEKPRTYENMTNAGYSADTSTNHFQTDPLSWAQHKANADEKVLQPSTATTTGKGQNGNGTDKGTPKEAATALVPFFALYRFHRPHEIALNILGLVCAFVSGAAQVSSSTYTLLSSVRPRMSV